mgnify:CR=1 FL=1
MRTMIHCLHIVEAEAGTEDVKGRILVANVIMNRIKNKEFPRYSHRSGMAEYHGVPQFSPTYDGRINEVTVTDETREAVRQALEGVDYSEGALFFIQKSEAESQNVSWFEKDLKRLFKYGVHEFYTYPDSGRKFQQDRNKRYSSYNSFNRIAVILLKIWTYSSGNKRICPYF